MLKTTYFVAIEASVEDLVIRVNELLDEGWKCQGGISHYNYPTWALGDKTFGIEHCQAMIKNEQGE